MAFHQNVTIVAVNPAMGYPPGVGPRWKFPTAWYPYVSAAVPAMIARNPDMVRTGTRYPSFDNWRGGPDADDHFGA